MKIFNKGNSKLLGPLIAFILTFAFLHSALHFAIYGTGIPLVAEKGISGLSIGPISNDDIKSGYFKSSLSALIIIGEWIVLIGAVSFNAVLRRRVVKKEEARVKDVKINLEKSKTEIDALYNLLKEKNHLSIKIIADIFKVKENVAEEWAKILESINLAEIYYPSLGDAELRIKK